MIFRNGTILAPGGPAPAEIRITGGIIAALEPLGKLVPDEDEEVFDAGGRWLLPGGIDAHTHFGMPLKGGVSSLGWRQSSEAALLGGTTTVIDFANPEPGEPLTAAVDRWQEAARGECLCDFGLHCTVTDTAPERLAEIPGLIARGIPTFKGFLAYKGRLMLDQGQMSALMEAIATAGGMLLVHAEDGELNAAAEQALIHTGRTGPNWHPASHPPESELKAVAEALDLAARAACPLTIVHVSLPGSVDLIDRARASRRHSELFAEVCLHHLLCDDSLYNAGHERALAAICSPPLRGAEDAANLREALAAGRFDLLSTDHCEFPLAIKTRAASGGFTAVPNGCGGVGERLIHSLTLALEAGRPDPAGWQDLVAAAPARIMGLGARKGRLQPGFDADIVCLDPAAQGVWRPLGLSDTAGNLYTGRPVTGRISDVWLRGRQVVRDGRLAAHQPGGEFLQRDLRTGAERT